MKYFSPSPIRVLAAWLFPPVLRELRSKQFVRQRMQLGMTIECSAIMATGAGKLMQVGVRERYQKSLPTHTDPHTGDHNATVVQQRVAGWGEVCECFCSEGFIVSQFRHLFFVASPVLFTLALPGLIFMGAGCWFIVGLSSFMRTGMMSGLAGSSVVPLFTR